MVRTTTVSPSLRELRYKVYYVFINIPIRVSQNSCVLEKTIFTLQMLLTLD